MKTTLFASISLATLLAVAPAMAQQSGTATTQAKPVAKTAPAKTATDNKAWVGLPVENKAGQKIGTVVDVLPASGKVTEIHAKIGSDTVKLKAKQVTKKDGKVIVSLTDAQLKKLPKVKG